MGAPLIRLAVSGAVAGGLMLTNGACTHLTLAEALPDAPPLADQPSGRQRLVQFRFGKDAAFGVCAEPACPVVTPKTLTAGTTASAHPVVNRSAATFDLAAERRAADEFATSSGLPLVPARPAMAASTAANIPGAALRNLVIGFPVASASLTDAAKSSLSASIRDARLSGRIVISGRTDGVGDDQVNETLALARALSVRDYLLDQIPDLAAAISIDAKGRCCFIASNETQDGRSKNRRVEIAFFARSEASAMPDSPESLSQRASIGPAPARDTP
jgi:outer membrane protein OmpA-like peptidoglycan-associated protein